MLRSANFTVRLTEPGSAAETTLRFWARTPKIAATIGPRRPLEVVEGIMMVSLECRLSLWAMWMPHSCARWVTHPDSGDYPAERFGRRICVERSQCRVEWFVRGTGTASARSRLRAKHLQRTRRC